mmetsp:Transcript_65950/g.147981  ORF Transcript_65950/g.147981 Transcript_65950/m.147981 type:complete len:368 (-) Transcript_65950:118-1221(-)
MGGRPCSDDDVVIAPHGERGELEALLLLGPHTAVGGQLEPRRGEGPVEHLGLLRELPGDRSVLLVVEQRHVAGEPHDAGQRGVVAALDPPLPVAAGANVLLPLAAHQDLEELVVPLGGLRRPRALEAAGEGVLALAGAALARPRVGGGILRRGAGALRASAMRLAEGVAAADERDRLGVVHAHPAEGVADVQGAALGVGVRLVDAVLTHHDGALGVEVDEPDGGAAQRLLAEAVGVAREALLLLGAGAQVQALGAVGGVQAPGAVLGHGAAHAVDRRSAGEREEVAPAEAVAVLLLHRPEQGPRLVEVRVVVPAALGLEALAAAGAAPAAVRVAVGAGAMPSQADEERPVVAVVRGPAVLRAGHQLA